jgi:hypothetical protein
VVELPVFNTNGQISNSPNVQNLAEAGKVKEHELAKSKDLIDR